MGFWIQLGVSGFRMDAVPFIIATKGPKVRKPEEQYDMLRQFREFLTISFMIVGFAAGWRRCSTATAADLNSPIA
jgi:glycosidase